MQVLVTARTCNPHPFTVITPTHLFAGCSQEIWEQYENVTVTGSTYLKYKLRAQFCFPVAHQPISDPGHLTVQVSETTHSHTLTHTLTLTLTPTHKLGRAPLNERSTRRKGHATYATHNKHTRRITQAPRRDSNPQSQQLNGFRPTS